MLRVLCVDDNRDLADSESLLLRLSGFDARACYSGKAALDLVDAFRPGMFLIDLNMPGMDGDELARHLRSRRDADPLLLVAVTAMDGAAAQGRIDGLFDRHLIKPVDPCVLIRLVRVEADARREGERWAGCLGPPRSPPRT